VTTVDCLARWFAFADVWRSIAEEADWERLWFLIGGEAAVERRRRDRLREIERQRPPVIGVRVPRTRV
jgi:hypothetical protein